MTDDDLTQLTARVARVRRAKDLLVWDVNGKILVSDVWQFCETHGVPLEIVVEQVAAQGGAVAWLDYHACARDAGMAHDAIVSRVREALVDAGIDPGLVCATLTSV